MMAKALAPLVVGRKVSEVVAPQVLAATTNAFAKAALQVARNAFDTDASGAMISKP